MGCLLGSRDVSKYFKKLQTLPKIFKIFWEERQEFNAITGEDRARGDLVQTNLIYIPIRPVLTNRPKEMRDI